MRLRNENKQLKEGMEFLKKSSGVLCEEPAVTYAYIRNSKPGIGIRRKCNLLGVHPQDTTNF